MPTLKLTQLALTKTTHFKKIYHKLNTKDHPLKILSSRKDFQERGKDNKFMPHWPSLRNKRPKQLKKSNFNL